MQTVYSICQKLHPAWCHSHVGELSRRTTKQKRTRSEKKKRKMLKVRRKMIKPSKAKSVVT